MSPETINRKTLRENFDGAMKTLKELDTNAAIHDALAVVCKVGGKAFEAAAAACTNCGNKEEL